MDLATEVRLQKRRTLLAYIENTPEFLAASAAARATRPEPEDLTKRQWERAIGLWRLRMRACSTRSEGVWSAHRWPPAQRVRGRSTTSSVCSVRRTPSASPDPCDVGVRRLGRFVHESSRAAESGSPASRLGPTPF